jgi:uncharacterized membrane protein YfcA
MTFSATTLILLTLTGVLIGVVSGMLGLGGGVFVIPALVFLFGFTHKQAIGTSMGMLLPPIGIFAFLAYWRAGEVSLAAAGMLAIGFAFGALAGSLLVTSGHIPDKALRLTFGFFLVYLAVVMILQSDSRAWAATVTIASLIGAAIGLAAMRVVGRRMEFKFSAREKFNTRLGEPISPDYEI